jgi:hypothetical protein
MRHTPSDDGADWALSTRHAGSHDTQVQLTHRCPGGHVMLLGHATHVRPSADGTAGGTHS